MSSSFDSPNLAELANNPELSQVNCLLMYFALLTLLKLHPCVASEQGQRQSPYSNHGSLHKNLMKKKKL